jgi:7,8-dihydropterin-6-yl-methyl-4-(beta-D-ribofuranosyl)aminobenzene 5'-phosphate synthase
VQLTVLVDNNTLIDRYFQGEPGLSFFIRDGEARILFDTGYSGLFLANARKMDIDLRRLDWVVLSHGHLDHTWGLDPLIRRFTEAAIEGQPIKRPTILGHPAVLGSRRIDTLPNIGSSLSEDKLSPHFRLRFSREPVWLTEHLVFLGEIPRIFEFEAASPLGLVMGKQGPEPDPLADDSALAYRSHDGLVLITGCAHAGICNTIEHARRVCGEERVADIIGGFHLLAPPAERLEETARRLETLGLRSLHPCHCTDLASKVALARRLLVEEVGVGLRLEYR